MLDLAERSGSRESGPTPKRDVLRHVHALIVDDDEDLREMLEAALGCYGAVVTAVDSVDEALTVATYIRPDVLLSDISMPGRDGYSLVKEIRARKGGGLIPAVAVTGCDSPADRQRASEAGFDALISKPVDLTSLIRTVAFLILQR
jgi:CheY-like chemotaxis protein